MEFWNLYDKIYLITGAGSGIGRETCYTLDSLGARLILLDINPEGLKETYLNLKNKTSLSLQIDITDNDSLEIQLKNLLNEIGPINGLVHCAGISSRKPLNMLRKEGFSKVMEVNFYSFVDLVRIISKKKYLQDGGSIIAMSSISSIKGYKAKTEYCVSKASLDAFIRCMALELAPRKIRINSIMAAEVNTPMAQKAKELNSVGNDSFETPLGITEPYEVANTIAFLLSEATKTITGSSILIDGGALLV